MSKYYRVGLKTGLSVKQIDPLATRLTEAGHTGGAGKNLKKTYVKADRDIAGTKAKVSYTKSRWKNWKKSKTEQSKRKQAYVEVGKQNLQAKYPGFKFKKGGKV